MCRGPLTHTCTACGAQVRDAREQLWAREEECRALRDKVEQLRRSLDERRLDVQQYQVRPAPGQPGAASVTQLLLRIASQ